MVKLKENKVNYYLLTICLIGYILLLIWVIGFKCARPYSILGKGYSLDPIAYGPTMSIYMDFNIEERFLYDITLRDDGVKSIITDIVLNTIVFLPIGILMPIYLKKHKYVYTGLICFLISLLFELFQLITSFGGFSFLDLIMNTVGGIIGSLLYLLLIKLIKPDKVNIVINACSVTISIIEYAIIGYAIYTVVTNFDVIAFRFLDGISKLK